MGVNDLVVVETPDALLITTRQNAQDVGKVVKYLDEKKLHKLTIVWLRRTMTQEIKFGTDGWRGIIADDFTFDNVRRVAGAIAAYVLKYEDPKRGVVVGYDARFASPRAAQIVAEVIAAAGIPVKLANDFTPTPAISYAVKQQHAAGGVMVTSSHNPWNWNGVKFKGNFGGSATPGDHEKN